MSFSKVPIVVLKMPRWFLLALLILSVCHHAVAQQYTWRTFAGPRVNAADGLVAEAQLYFTTGLARAADGTIYFSDELLNVIRKLTPQGEVQTIAGLKTVSGRVDGVGSAARFSGPRGLHIDLAGNLYVADRLNHCIRKISPSGQVMTLAGSIASQSGATDATGTEARFNLPAALAMDSDGNLYVADTGNHVIRRVTSSGTVTTLAGAAGQAGSADGTGDAARFSSPTGICMANDGNLYVTDYDTHILRKVNLNGVVITLAGTAGVSGIGEGTGAAARFNRPGNLCQNSLGDLIISDTGSWRLKKATLGGVVTVFAGGFSPNRWADGDAQATRFQGPAALSPGPNGEVYLADRENWCIRRIESDGRTTTIAGRPNYGSSDGRGGLARFFMRYAGGLAQASDGNLYVGDSIQNLIRRINPERVVSAVAGQAMVSGSLDGPALQATLSAPTGLAFDASGDLFMTMAGDHLIRKLTAAGQVLTVAGTKGTSGSVDGEGALAKFNTPNGMAFDSIGGGFLVCDSGSHVIRHISAAGQVRTVAGLADVPGATDGIGANARFNRPTNICINPDGVVFITDTNNHCIRRLARDGTVSIFAGKAGVSGSADGALSTATFNSPHGIASDASGNLFVTDGFARVRRIGTDGSVSTIGGASNSGWSEGIGTQAKFLVPSGLTVAANGLIYVLDSANDRVMVGGIMPAQEILGPDQSVIGVASSSLNLGQVYLGASQTRDFSLRNNGTAALQVSLGLEGASAADFSLSGTSASFNIAPGGSQKLTLRFEPIISAGWRSARLRINSNDVIEPEVLIDLESQVTDPRPFVGISAGQMMVDPGGIFSISTTVISGVRPFSYQWRCNSLPLRGATLESLTIAKIDQVHEGSYDCVVSNSYGSFISPPCLLTVRDPVVIKQGPLSQYAALGGEVLLSARATGTGPLSYQWRFNGQVLADAIEPRLVFQMTEESAGLYDVEVRNALGGVTSAAARLTLLAVPQITRQPEAFIPVLGGSGQLSVTAVGGALTYQWRRNGSNLANQTSATLYFNRFQQGQEGVYDVIVRNASGQMVSAPASLRLVVPIEVIQQPRDVVADVGEEVSFEVATNRAADTLTYQWLKDGRPLVGAKSAVLRVRVTDASSAGAYSVVVSNAAGKANSLAAFLRVRDPGLLIYDYNATGNSFVKQAKVAATLRGVLLVDRAGGRGALLRQRSFGSVSALRVEILDPLFCQSTGPLQGTQTVLQQVNVTGAMPALTTQFLWLQGMDGIIKFSEEDSTVAPKSMQGEQREVNSLDGLEITGLQIRAAIDLEATRVSRSVGESLEQAIQRITALLQAKGIVLEGGGG